MKYILFTVIFLTSQSAFSLNTKITAIYDVEQNISFKNEKGDTLKISEFDVQEVTDLFVAYRLKEFDPVFFRFRNLKHLEIPLSIRKISIDKITKGFPLLEHFEYFSTKCINLNDEDFLVNNPNIKILKLQSMNGIKNFPSGLANFPSSNLHVDYIYPTSKFTIQSSISTPIISFGYIDTASAKIILKSIDLETIKYLELRTKDEFNLPPELNFNNSDSLIRIALNLSGNSDDMNKIASSNSIEVIDLFNCPSDDQLLTFNKMPKLDTLIIRKISKKRKKHLESFSQQLTFSIVVL